MRTELYVDWENYWIGLRCAGYSVEPTDAMAALIRAVRANDRGDMRVVVVTKPEAPMSSERRALLARAEALGATAAMRNVNNRKPNGADIEIGFFVGQAVERGDAQQLVIASGDSDLVDVAGLALAARRVVEGVEPVRVVLAYCARDDQDSPKAPEGCELLELRAAVAPLLPAVRHRWRAPTAYDLAAWSLARAIAPAGLRYEATMLHAESGGRPGSKRRRSRAPEPEPEWWQGLSRYPVSDELITAVDRGVWWVQRLVMQERLVVDPEAAAQIIAARDPRLQHSTTAILDALLTADLLRLDRKGAFARRPALREAIIMPVRRAILRLLREPDGTVSTAHLRGLHNRAVHRGVRPEERDDSWRLVTRVMAESWKVATVRRVDLRTEWRLRREQPLVVDTERKARRLLDVLDGRRMTTNEVKAAVGEDWVDGRWLRIMRDARLLDHDGEGDGTYGGGEQGLPPES